jgi:hypothetical protein
MCGTVLVTNENYELAMELAAPGALANSTRTSYDVSTHFQIETFE